MLRSAAADRRSGVRFRPIFTSKSLFHLSVVWRVPCVLVTALGSRCHLEGPVTATVPTVRSWTAPGPEEALQPATEDYISSLANLAEGFRGVACQGSPGRTEKDPAGPSLVQLPSLMGFRGKWVGALFLGHKVAAVSWPGACSARLQEERPARGEGVAGCS